MANAKPIRTPTRGPTRRDWLRAMMVGGGALALHGVVGCGDNQALPNVPTDIVTAIHAPWPQGFLLPIWSPTSQLLFVTVEQVATGLAVFTTMVELAAGTATTVEVADLTPHTAYHVYVENRYGSQAGPYSVTTPPLATDNVAVRLGLFADIDPNLELYQSPIFSTMTAFGADLSVTLGDAPYCDNGPAVAQTLEEYRAVHAGFRSRPEVYHWLRTAPLQAIYDDHEFRNDWHSETIAEEPVRYAGAMGAWDEFFPLPSTLGRNVRYRKWNWGAQLDCFMLDCRQFRSRTTNPDNESKTMLGAAQLQWLKTSLVASRAAVKLIVTPVPLDFGSGPEHWAAFQYEREQLFAFLAQAKITGVLFVAGDQHWFAAHRHKCGAREFQVGPVARGPHTPGAPVPEVLFRSLDYNFGELQVANGVLTMRGVGAMGNTIYSEELMAASLVVT